MDLKTNVTKLLMKTLSSDNLKILKCEYPNVKLTGGYVAQLINVKVHIERNGVTDCLDLIVKSGIVDSENIFTEAHFNEIDLYTNIVSHFNRFAEDRKVKQFENIPVCYGTSKTDNLVMIIMENLTPKNYKVHKLEPLDLNHIKLVLEAYANWHAFSFALNDQEPNTFQQLGKRNMKLDDWKIIEALVTSLEEQIDYVIKIYEEKQKTESLKRLRLLRKNYRNLMDEFLRNENENYLVITHADVWNNNFLFKYNEKDEPIDVKIVDWQTAVVGSPLIDVAQIFFCCCCRRPELDQMNDLLSLYHNCLSEKIRQLGSDPDKCFPLDECRKSFKRYAPLGIAVVPFLMRMFFDGTDPDETNTDTSNGDFGSILKQEVSDLDGFFEAVDSLIELCIAHDLI